MSYFRGPDISKGLPMFKPNTSILKIILEVLHINGENTALVEGDTGKEASFKDILHQSRCICNNLQRIGITASDILVFCCNKSIVAYSLILGTMFTGATAVLIPTPFSDNIAVLTKEHKIKVVFYDALYEDSVNHSISQMASAPNLRVVVDINNPNMASLFTPTQQLSIFEVEDIRKHIPLVLFSSGTTNEPKGIQITDMAVQLFSIFLGRHCSSFLTSSALFWGSGFFPFISSILYKYKLVVSNSKEPKQNLDLIEKHKVEMCFLGTGALNKYIYECDQHLSHLASLKLVIVGGEIVLSSVVEQFINKVLGKNIKLEIVYGTTESGMLTTLDPKPHLKLGNCGVLNPGVEIKILNEDGKIIPPGCRGEIWVKSLAATPGYWGRPDLNSQLFDKDHFCNTGDVGFFDSDGHIYLRGRATDLITFRDNKFAPAELENILTSHPDVLEAAVVGRPHPIDHEWMAAFVALIPGSQLTENQLQAYIDGQVEEHKKLRGGIYFVDMLPRTVIGKIQRKLLREGYKV